MPLDMYYYQWCMYIKYIAMFKSIFSDASTYTSTCMYNDISCINYHFSLLLLQYLSTIFPRKDVVSLLAIYC